MSTPAMPAPWEPQIEPSISGCAVQPVRRGASGEVSETLGHWYLLARISNVAKYPKSLREAKRSLRLCAEFCATRNQHEQRVAATIAAFESLLK